MVQTPQKRKLDTKLRRTETEPEIWTVQKDCQNSTSTDQKHSRRHEPRRKGRDIQRHIRRKFYCHNGHTQNSSVIITDSRMRSMHISIPIVIKTITGKKTVETKVLLDTGAEGLFMDKNYAEEHEIVLQKLPNPITPSNVDGTLNHAGEITHFTWIQAKIDKRTLLEKLWITDLGSSDVIFGFPWFKENNPQIVWKTGRVQLPKADLETTFLYLTKDG